MMQQADSYFPDDSNRSLVNNNEAELVMAHDGQIGLIDHDHGHIYWLVCRSYYLGFKKLSPWPPEHIGIYRDATTEAIGFWLNGGAKFVGLLTADPVFFKAVPHTTIWLATPNGLHRRNKTTNDWDTILWHPQSK